jgi:hypothetical protein
VEAEVKERVRKERGMFDMLPHDVDERGSEERIEIGAEHILPAVALQKLGRWLPSMRRLG